jgi:hypothetical protein
MTDHDFDLDRLIDRAAEQLVAREPSSALTRAVMARVHERKPERSTFRIANPKLWFSAAAVSACVWLLIALYGPPVPPTPVLVPITPAVLQPYQAPPAAVLDLGPVPRAARIAPRSTRPAPLVQLDNAIFIDPIEFAPVEVAGIEFPAEADTIEIEPLVIESLAANN